MTAERAEPLPTPVPAPARIEALDGVRGLAIVAVVCMHCALLGLADARMGEQPLMRFLLLGWCGVDLFFVLSGFLITGILVRSKGSPHYFRNFYARRSLRIFPLYYAVIVLMLFVLDRPPMTTAEKVPYFLYYQNFAWWLTGEGHPDLARAITWSLCVEEQFYLFWPAVVLCSTRRALPYVCIAMAVVALVTRFGMSAAGVKEAYFLTPCRLDTLALGSFLALVPQAPPWLGRLCAVGGIAGLVATSFVTGSSLPQDNPGMQRWGLVFALAFAVGIFVLARGNGITARICHNRVLRSFGTYSYCIYLVHMLVLEWVTGHWVAFALANPAAWSTALEYCSGPVVLALFTTMCLAAVWLVAFASWHLFEKRFLQWKRFFGH